MNSVSLWKSLDRSTSSGLAAGTSAFWRRAQRRSAKSKTAKSQERRAASLHGLAAVAVQFAKFFRLAGGGVLVGRGLGRLGSGLRGGLGQQVVERFEPQH